MQHAKTRTGTRIGDRYELVAEIGRGASGKVYRGVDCKNHNDVAVKEISLERLRQGDIASIMGEVELLKSLNHRNVVQYLGSFQTRQNLYIVMELVEAGSLASVLKRGAVKTFPEVLVGMYVDQILNGLEYLHAQGVVHRDIKGANILTTRDGMIKLADFGVAAKLSTSAQERDGWEDGEDDAMPAGTPYWMAPEVVELKNVTVSSDIWSVGCVAIELLTGRPPYFDLQPLSAMYNIVQDPHPPLPCGISDNLKDFLLLCFLKDPLKRPSAKTLGAHPWILENRTSVKSLRADTCEEPDSDFAMVIERMLSCGRSTPALIENENVLRGLGENVTDGGQGNCQHDNHNVGSHFIDNEPNRQGDLTKASAGRSPAETLPFHYVQDDITGSATLKILQESTHGVLAPSCDQGSGSFLQDADDLIRQVESLRIASTAIERSLVQEAAAAASARVIDGYLSSNDNLAIMFYQADGLACLREALDSQSERLLVPCLDLLLTAIDTDAIVLEHICSLGLIPAAMRFALKNFSLELRRRAALLAKKLVCGSPSSASFFVACQGIPFAMALMEDDEDDLELSFGAISIFWALLRRSLEPRAGTWPNQYLRLLAHHDLPQKLSVALTTALDTLPRIKNASVFLEATVNLFGALSNGDKVVKARCSRPGTISKILAATVRLPTKLQWTILTAFNSLTTEGALIANLEEANGVAYAAAQLARADAPDLQTSGLRALEHLCLLSRNRLEKAVKAGAVPWLCQIAIEQKDASSCGLLCSMVHASKDARDTMWNAGAQKVLIELLKDDCCAPASFEALVHWLECDQTRLEPELVDNIGEILHLVPERINPQQHKVDTLSITASLLTSLVSKSSAIGLAMAEEGLPLKVSGLLLMSDASAVLSLVDLLKALCTMQPNLKTILNSNSDVRSSLDVLAEGAESLVVQDKARQLLHLINDFPEKNLHHR
jgi:serine/threonine protein kinase